MDYQESPQTLVDADFKNPPFVTRVETPAQKPFDVTISKTFNASLKPRAQGENPSSFFNVESVTLSGGPIRSKHFQQGPTDFNQRHTFTSLRIDTENYGNWAIYALTPNSVRNNSFGLGYATDAAKFQIGPVGVEASLMFGLVTGYQKYPLPMMGANLRLNLYETSAFGGRLSFGAEMSAMPYIGQRAEGEKWHVGIVGTAPYLSVRYEFGADKMPSRDGQVLAAAKPRTNGM